MERITGPLEMRDTYVEGYDDVKKSVADSYHIAESEFEKYMDRIGFSHVQGSTLYNLSRGRDFNSWAYAAGAINSNTDDLLNFGLGVLDQRIAVPGSWKEALKSGAIGGAGGPWGISASMLICGSPETIIITLANSKFPMFQAFHISDEIFQILKDKTNGRNQTET